MPTKINVDKLSEGLRTKRLGKHIFFTREVDSTNTWAKQLAKLGAEEGTVAIAEIQTAGRGRSGREWFSPEGSLYFSVILRPRMRASETVGLVFVAGLAVAETLREMYNLKAETKWPNDVLVNERKICGILCEMSTKGNAVDFVVAGLGVNVNFGERTFPESIRGTATSVQNELGKTVPIERMFRTMLEKFEDSYDLYVRDGLAAVLHNWKKLACFLGREIDVVSGSELLSGVALDVDATGALVLRLRDGTVRSLVVGDVSLHVK